ncbi:MAG: fumarylacetoacetate hydrolase family protein [Spirochaetaceae bacterium]|nr:MAG: fumarylacetoacetate hydrolase family protein [Spirochaetaceae bacterium]
MSGLSWDELFRLERPRVTFSEALEGRGDLLLVPVGAAEDHPALAPVESQEIWAAGVSYFRSRDARMAESVTAGGGSFYDRVYEAQRPELFYKGSSRTVAGPNTEVHIRKDSKWNVPEPELTLAINRQGQVFGFTIGNDMSSRDIEGENPLYLPQAKVYDGSAALGPGVLLADSLPMDTDIGLCIERAGGEVFSGHTAINNIKRSFASLVEFLFRENSFPAGCYLMTGTGIVPPNDFTLLSGDSIHITIPPIGTLSNTVA